MKIIQALKQIKDLKVKAEDIRRKISVQCAHPSFETPTYGTRQREQVAEWLQAHSDIIKEVMRLNIALQNTNLQTRVKIDLGGKTVEKSIAEWVLRRRSLAQLEQQAWGQLTDRGIKEGHALTSQGERVEVKIVRNFDPEQRDKMMELYRSEPTIIDGELEIVNATTDLIEG